MVNLSIKEENIDPVTLLDDGQLYVQIIRGRNYTNDRAPSYLMARPVKGGPIRDSDLCIGYAKRMEQGAWEVYLYVSSDEFCSTSEVFAEHAYQMDAIVSLWQLRKKKINLQ